MNSESDRFLKDLPTLLRLLADPTTPHTSLEIWDRIMAFGWDECVPYLMQELNRGEPDVKRLVISVLSQELEQMGSERAQPFISHILNCLSDPDRLVRIAAVQVVRDFRLDEAIPFLRRVVCEDERPLATEALLALMELDDELINDVIETVRAGNR